MYTITCDDVTLLDARIENLKVLNPKLSTELNKTGTLTFDISPLHPRYNKINKLSSVIRLYDNGELLFEGRVMSDKKDFYNVKSVECEGELGYLLDSIQMPKTYSDLTPQSYLEDKIAQHNAQVEQYKRFEVGVVEFDTMNYDAREDNNYPATLDCIMDKVINSMGGYLRVRHSNGTRYLDYVQSYGNVCNQVIEFGKNLLDLTQLTNAEDIKTAVIPIGKDGLTIETVNDGKAYVYDQAAVNLYGWIYEMVKFDDVTVAANLKTKAEEYLASKRNLSLTIELSAVDLSDFNINFDRIRLGDQIRVISKPHGLDRYFTVAKYQLDLFNKQNSKITLGDTLTGLTDKQLAIQKGYTSVSSIANQAAQQARLASAEAESAVNKLTQAEADFVTQKAFGVVVPDLIARIEALEKAESEGAIRKRIVEIAVGELGNGWNKYCNWWGVTYRFEWCACFVDWCADQVGVLGTNIPRSTSCGEQIAQWQSWGKWQSASYTPRAGDIIYYDWDPEEVNGADHVGIVETVNGGTYTVIEGNYSDTDKVARRSITSSYPYIYGFGVPVYPGE